MAAPIILGPDGRPLKRAPAPLQPRLAVPPPAWWAAWRAEFRQRIGA